MYVDPYGLVRWKDAGFAFVGLLGNGFGVIIGGALIAAPEPASTALGSVVTTKSLAGVGLNSYNLARAISDDDSYDAPSSLGRAVATAIDPCDKDLERVADGVELAIDFASGRASIGYLPQSSSALGRRATFSEVMKFDHGRFGHPMINSSINAMQTTQSFMYTYDAVMPLVEDGGNCGCK